MLSALLLAIEMKLDELRLAFKKAPEQHKPSAPERYDCRASHSCLGGCANEREHFFYNRKSAIQVCEGECREFTRCYSVPSQTMYVVDIENEKQPDPNADRWMCYECGQRYTQMMNDQWADYYRDVMY